MANSEQPNYVGPNTASLLQQIDEIREYRRTQEAARDKRQTQPNLQETAPDVSLPSARQTTQDKIEQRLRLLPDDMLEKVLLFIDFLLYRLKISTSANEQSQPDFAQALTQFRDQAEAEGSDIEETDFFADARDRRPNSETAR